MAANSHNGVLFAAAIIWLYFIGQQISSESHGLHHHTHNGYIPLFGDRLLAWMLMVYAMMLPMTSATIRAVMNKIPIFRQRRSLAIFVVGFSLMWLLFGVALLLLSDLVIHFQIIEFLEGIPCAAIAYALAGLISDSRFRIRLLSACGSVRAPRISGVGADIDTLKIGLYEGWKCVQTCAHIMIAMQIAGHSLVQMLALTAALFYEKHLYRNKHGVVKSVCIIIAIWEAILFYQPMIGSFF